LSTSFQDPRTLFDRKVSDQFIENEAILIGFLRTYFLFIFKWPFHLPLIFCGFLIVFDRFLIDFKLMFLAFFD